MRLRFTIRDLLWLAVVAALAVGWWVDHHRPNAHFDYYGSRLLNSHAVRE